MTRASLVVAALALAGCPKPQKQVVPLADFSPSGGGNPTQAALAELQDDILDSYERDDVPDIKTGMINPPIGGTRIGVGPGDIEMIGNPARASSRWPLDVSRDLITDVRSKRLEIHAAQDLSAAWMYDELSWRVEKCGRTAVIPLRLTALYAHDGDRWIQVYEHLSFARIPEPTADAARWVRIEPVRKELRVPQALADELSRTLAPVLSLKLPRDRVLAAGPEALLLGPDVPAEWHGADVLRARLVDGTLRAEDRQLGTVGRTLARATIAYWIGNFTADLAARPGIPAGKVLLRGTFVFEKRDGHWVVVAGHLHEPIDDTTLAQKVFGTSLLAAKPLELACDDGAAAGAAVTPAAAP